MGNTRIGMRWVSGIILSAAIAAGFAPATAGSGLGPVRHHATCQGGGQAPDDNPDQVLEWNQIFIDMLIKSGTPNSSSQRLGAIVHTAIFDAYNGIERRYTPVFVSAMGPQGASRRAAVIAAAYTALRSLFGAQQSELDMLYRASLDALSEDGEDGGQARALGILWGKQVAAAVLAWRANDGFGGVYDPFRGGTEVGQWRPTPPAFGPMSAQGLAFTRMFVLADELQFRPGPPRDLASETYTEDFNTVKRLGRRTGSDRSDEQTLLAPFWEGNATVHWNQAANQIACANYSSISASNRLLALLNIVMADTAITTWSAKRFYGDTSPAEVTWRPVTSIPLADDDGNSDTSAEAGWLPLVNTPSHPEYPAGHPSLNGAAATVLLSHFDDSQTFTLTTGPSSRTYTSIAQARSDGNNARVWGGMHYPTTVEISDAEGEAIARYIDVNAMLLTGGGGQGSDKKR